MGMFSEARCLFFLRLSLVAASAANAVQAGTKELTSKSELQCHDLVKKLGKINYMDNVQIYHLSCGAVAVYEPTDGYRKCSVAVIAVYDPTGGYTICIIFENLRTSTAYVHRSCPVKGKSIASRAKFFQNLKSTDPVEHGCIYADGLRISRFEPSANRTESQFEILLQP
ncbi:hypothetical protein HHK36_019034 [Tetracentron sinense]|uniref:Uncharacterized protein n=1 Tax=Tetracentron sinense TaxID=13715 RepID=A0A834YT81_TETSI|nr:hypothetical protein HHK36_019034 [Tetracentron sinense]